MTEYIDITYSTVFTGFVGLISPVLFPWLFKLLGKWAKRALTSQEKRLVITSVAFWVSVGVVAYYFEWNGESFIERAWAFIMFLFVNFVTLRGVIQSVYEIIVKTIPGFEERLREIEK